MFACQVLEYHPEPWNQWITVGDLEIAKGWHAALPIGTQQLPCLAGEHSKDEEGWRQKFVIFYISVF